MSAHSYIYVTIFYFLNYLFFKKKFFFFFLKMMLTYHISHEKFFSTALYVHGRSGVKTVKHPKSVMVWDAFTGDKGRGGLYFLPKKVTMREDNYLRILDHHMLPFWDIHRCSHFIQDGALAHRSKVVKKWLKDNHVHVLECPRNSLDLNPIENAWN